MRAFAKSAARLVMRVTSVAAALALAWGAGAPSAPRDKAAGEAVLIRLVSERSQRVIQDSKWGVIGRLQEAINHRAVECGVAPVIEDGLYGRATAEAARKVAQCRGLEMEGAAPPHLTVATWRAVTGAPTPSAADRARTLARTLEATDYDALEWNVCVPFKGDQGSVLTWGPYGKTLGWGGEIMSVLNRLERSTVLTVFAAEGADGVDKLFALKTARELGVKSHHVYPGARALMESVCREPGQMTAWSRAFARLGRMEEVQRVYEDVAWGDSAWFRYVVERLERSWRKAGLEPSEVDFAFFVDRSIHMGWGQTRFEAVDRALSEMKYCTRPDAFTNARARLAVADAVRAKAREDDRLARDAMFLVDSEAALSDAMARSPSWPADWKAKWKWRAGISAADVGLSDARPAPGFEDGVERVIRN